MKTLSLFMLTVIALCFTSSELHARHHCPKHGVCVHKAGHSKEKRPKHTTSPEEKRKPEKKHRGDKKRDRYGAFINAPKGRKILDEIEEGDEWEFEDC